MHRTASFLSVASAAVSLAFLAPAVALADPAPAPPPPTTPTYICDKIDAVPPAVFGYTNCEAFGGVPRNDFLLNGGSYMLIPRNGDPESNIQKYRCYGGYADLPTSIAPAGCSPVGPRIPASAAPPPVPFSGP